MPGALALTGTHPATALTALTALMIYRVAGYWTPGAVGAAPAALLTRRHPGRAARPATPLRPQAPPPPAPGTAAQPTAGGFPRRCPPSQSCLATVDPPIAWTGKTTCHWQRAPPRWRDEEESMLRDNMKRPASTRPSTRC